MAESAGTGVTEDESLQLVRNMLADDTIRTITEGEFTKGPRIGCGGFGEVFSCKMSDGSRVAAKLIRQHAAADLFIKEIKLLNLTRHPNVVTLKGVCIRPFSIIMQMVEFDLRLLKVPFEHEYEGRTYGHNLGDLLGMLSPPGAYEAIGIRHGVLLRAAFDIARGLAFLHAKTVCHRDMMPRNVLVTNSGPYLKCILTDFGEARSPEIQTGEIHSRTENVKRGALPFQAPEQMLQLLLQANFDSLKKIDVWAYGMTLYCILNPDLPYPWRLDSHTQYDAMAARQKPKGSDNFCDLQEQTGLLDVYNVTAEYDPSSRPDMETVVDMILGKMCASDNTGGEGALNERGIRRKDSTDDWSCTVTAALGDTVEGDGYLEKTCDICCLKNKVFVTDREKGRLVAFKREYPHGRYTYLAHMEINEPRFCVANKDTDTVYVSSHDKHVIYEVRLEDEGGRLSAHRKLTAGGKTLLKPRGLCIDSCGEHIYVCTKKAVHKVNLKDDKVVQTLLKPMGLKHRPDRVSVLNDTVMVVYDEDEHLVLYKHDRALGRVIQSGVVRRPRGLCHDGVNFLVGDKGEECIHVIVPDGTMLTQVTTDGERAYTVSEHEGSLYIRWVGVFHHIYIMSAKYMAD